MSTFGNNIEAKIRSWSVGGDVANTFDQHIEKSVPGYSEGHDLISKLVSFFLDDNGSKSS